MKQDRQKELLETIVKRVEQLPQDDKRRIIETVCISKRKDAVKPTFPLNMKTGRAYQGMNALLIALVYGRDFDNSLYIGYKQAIQLGGNVKKGERSVPIRIPIIKKQERKGEDGLIKKEDVFSGITYKSVFNYRQLENVPLPERFKFESYEPSVLKASSVKMAEEIIEFMEDKPTIEFSSNGRNCYAPDTKTITLVPRSELVSDDYYFCTYFHELAHYYSHELEGLKDVIGTSREKLDPKKLSSMKIEDIRKGYNYGEYLAEFTAQSICNFCGIGNKEFIDNRAVYIESWVGDVMKNPQLMAQVLRDSGKIYTKMVAGYCKRMKVDEDEGVE